MRAAKLVMSLGDLQLGMETNCLWFFKLMPLDNEDIKKTACIDAVYLAGL